MKKFIVLLALVLPLASQAALNPRENFNYPGYRHDREILDSYYDELKKDRRNSKKSAVRKDQIRIADMEAEIRDKQDDYEDFLRKNLRNRHERGQNWHPSHRYPSDEDYEHDDHHDHDHDRH